MSGINQFVLLFQRTYAKLLGLLIFKKGLSKQDAEDVARVAYLTVLADPRPLTRRHQRRLLFRVAKQRATDLYRKKKTHNNILLATEDSMLSEPGPEEHDNRIATSRESHLLEGALLRLSDKHLKVAFMVYGARDTLHTTLRRRYDTPGTIKPMNCGRPR